MANLKVPYLLSPEHLNMGMQTSTALDVERTYDACDERWVPGQTTERVDIESRERYRFAAQYVAGMSVLDVACGSGAGSHFLASETDALSVLGIDISRDAVHTAAERYSHSRLSYDCGDLETLSLREQFDVATCFETIEHVQDDQKALRALHNALRPGGRLLLSTPNRPLTSPEARHISDSPRNPYHIREYTFSELRLLLADVGFVVNCEFGQRLQFRTGFRPVDIAASLLRDLRNFNAAIHANPKVTKVPALFASRSIIFVASKTV